MTARMATVKVRKLDPSSAGITIPVDELRREGIVVSDPGEPIELDGEHQAFIDREGEGEWKVKLAKKVLVE